MTQDEYILGLLAIISGLAVSHMIGALHGILFNRHMVRWDWLMPITAALVLGRRTGSTYHQCEQIRFIRAGHYQLRDLGSRNQRDG